MRMSLLTDGFVVGVVNRYIVVIVLINSYCEQRISYIFEFNCFHFTAFVTFPTLITHHNFQITLHVFSL